MLKENLLKLFFCFVFASNFGQTTDLAISVEAQDLSGSDISQVHIFEEFQYIVTISNVGDSVNNAVFTQAIDSNAIILSYISQNAVGGATLITDLNASGNTLTGTIASLPTSSSIEVKVIVRAPSVIGGIATNVEITPPDSVTDTNTSNNISIISIDVTDTPIDFTVTHTQISPPEGTAISAWNDTVTYRFTITNHSVIDFPLDGFATYLELNTPQVYGEPLVQVVSIECVNSTNGTVCINDIDIPVDPIFIDSNSVITILNYDTAHLFTSGGSLTFEIIYQYLEPACATDNQPIDVTSFVGININHVNESPNESNTVITNLIEASLCQVTDVCIETIQINPVLGSAIDWNEEVTFETTICNNGPLDADVLASFRNISNNALWDIISIECIQSDTTISCDLLSFADAGQYWVSNIFNMPVGEIVTIQTVIIFLEPECAIGSTNTDGIIRTSITVESEGIFDDILVNNTDIDLLSLPPAPECEESDIGIFKTQIIPALPEGGDIDNTTSWGLITYEIEVVNYSNEDVVIELVDYFPSGSSNAIGILDSIDCVSTTGTASCFTIEHANIGVELDGVPDEDNNPDVFWEILSEDNWGLPANSSVTFQVVINWLPVCSASAIPVTNSVSVDPADPFVDLNPVNNESHATSYFAPCLDLVVQTFPEFPTVIVNQPFNWIVDITNSATSSTALDVFFEDEIDIPFTINGTPTCQITSGIATCMSAFNVTNNIISGTIPIMEASSTIRIIIPVQAPLYGGAYTNTAQAFASDINNEELTPETNISISSVQVIAPTLIKTFNPEEIVVGEESILTFIVNNLASNPEQSNISFIDNLPLGLTISGEAFWNEANGCTATFTSEIGGSTIEVSNLSFPEGIETCSFSIAVTSNIEGVYLNNNSNFTNQINLDTSMASASLIVIDDGSEPEDCYKIPQIITPNDDGSNDMFIVPCIEDYPNTLLKIYNRYGVSVFESNNYLNNWAGKPNRGVLHESNKRLPVGTYFYVIKQNNLSKPIIGWVYLNY